MIALLQRVTHAQVRVNNAMVASINKGVLVFLAVEKNDTTASSERMLKRVLHYRIFADHEGKMSLNIQGNYLCISMHK